jgi:hypothetical protein
MMKWFGNFLGLAWSEYLLFIEAVFLLGIVKLGLKLLSFYPLHKFLIKIAQIICMLWGPCQVSIDKVIWSVRVIAPYLRATCLPQALVTQILLSQCGYSTRLHIGFTINKGGQISAHAWVESEGKIAIGGAGNMNRYIRLPLQVLKNGEKNRWYLFS